MPRGLAPAFTRQRLCVDFATLKYACPKGVYVAPVPEEPLLWTGALFVRRGPYANAVLRFQIEFAQDYPQRPPTLVFQSEVFHPLVTPLTTYTYSTRDPATDTVSATDQQRLPPGGLSLCHGFPEWFPTPQEDGRSNTDPRDPSADGRDHATQYAPPPHVVEVLQYLRIIFDTEEVLDSIPLHAAANESAWHAWSSYRSRTAVPASGFATRSAEDRSEASSDRSTSPRQQPGGARRPGEWNWQGVWEDRVRKSKQASSADSVLFGGSDGGHHVINFLKMDQDALDELPLEKLRVAT